MARLFTSGAETGTNEWNGASSGTVFVSASSSVKRTGDYSWDLYSSGTGYPAYFRQVFDDNETEIFGRFALRIASAASALEIRLVSFRDSDNVEQFAIEYNPGTSCLDWRNGARTLLAAGNALIPADTWVVVEFRAVIGSSGSLTMKVNGTTDAVFSGDTDYTNAGDVRSIYFGDVLLSGNFLNSFESHVYIDDIAINDTAGSYQNSWIGLGGVFYLEPTADGDQTDWTPSQGTVNYAMVDDIPPDNATTFNQANADGSIDLYEVDNCPDYINTINLVQVCYRAALVTSGYNETTDLVKVSGTVYSGVEWTIVPITPSFTYYLGTVHYLNPATGSAWGTAEVNVMQAGIEITSG